MSQVTPQSTPIGPVRLFDRLAEVGGLRLLLWCYFSAWFLWPYLSNLYDIVPTGDYTFFVNHAISTYNSIVEYHQLPLWDPYNCGGVPGIGNLQTNSLSPSVFLLVFFGPLAGLKLLLFAYQIIGMEGAYRYAKSHGALGIGALAAALCFAVNGRMISIWTAGQPVLSGFMLVPLLLLCYERSFKDMRWAIGGAFVMTWIFFEGGAVATPYSAIALLLVAVIHTIAALLSSERRSTWYRPALGLALMAIITVGISSVRLLPVIDTLVSAERVWNVEEGYSFATAAAMLFTQGSGNHTSPGSSYIGLWVVGVGLFGLLLLNKRVLLLIVLCLLLYDVSMGFDGVLHIFEGIREFRSVGDLRNPWRLHMILALFMAVAAGVSLSRLEHLVRAGCRRLLRLFRPAAKPSGFLLSTIVALPAFLLVSYLAYRVVEDPVTYNRQRIEEVEQRDPPLFMRQPFQQSLGNRWDIHVWPALNMGSLQCIEAQNFPTTTALQADLEHEEYLLDPEAGSIERLNWSTNRISVALNLSHETVVLVNQNAHQGWQVDRGEIVAHEGLIAARVPAGEYTLTFEFSDPWVIKGAYVTLFTLACLVAFWALSRRRRKAISNQSANSG